jgi:hypothetical protein
VNCSQNLIFLCEVEKVLGTALCDLGRGRSIVRLEGSNIHGLENNVALPIQVVVEVFATLHLLVLYAEPGLGIKCHRGGAAGDARLAAKKAGVKL